MSYYSGGASKETPEEAVNRIWRKAANLKEFVRTLTLCEWRDGWSEEEFEEFNALVLAKFIEVLV